jgi:transcriptional regulator with XRE-family HTH domain
VDPAYPKELRTVGDHLRKKRFDLALLQKEVATILGVTTNTLGNWELGVNYPYISCFPKIIEFLGYDPLFTDPKSLGQQVAHYRRVRGGLWQS